MFLRLDPTPATGTFKSSRRVQTGEGTFFGTMHNRRGEPVTIRAYVPAELGSQLGDGLRATVMVVITIQRTPDRCWDQAKVVEIIKS